MHISGLKSKFNFLKIGPLGCLVIGFAFARYVFPAIFFNLPISSLEALDFIRLREGFAIGLAGTLALSIGYLSYGFFGGKNRIIPLNAKQNYYGVSIIIGFALILCGILLKIYRLSQDNFSYVYSDVCSPVFLPTFFMSINFLQITGAIILCYTWLSYSDETYFGGKRDCHRVINWINKLTVGLMVVIAILSPDTGRNPIISILFGYLILSFYLNRINLKKIVIVVSCLVLIAPIKNTLKDVTHVNAYFASSSATQDFACLTGPLKSANYTNERSWLDFLYAVKIGQCLPNYQLPVVLDRAFDFLINASNARGIKNCAEDNKPASVDHSPILVQGVGERNYDFSAINIVRFIMDTTVARLNQIQVLDYLYENRNEYKNAHVLDFRAMFTGSWVTKSEYNFAYSFAGHAKVGVGSNFLGEVYVFYGFWALVVTHLVFGAILRCLDDFAAKNTLGVIAVAVLSWPLTHNLEQSIPPMVQILVKYSVVVFVILILMMAWQRAFKVSNKECGFKCK